MKTSNGYPNTFALFLFIIGIGISYYFSHDSKMYADTIYEIASSNFGDHEREIKYIKESINSKNLEFDTKINKLENNIYGNESKKALDIIKDTGVLNDPLVVSSVSVVGDIVYMTIHFGECDGCVTDVSVNLSNKTVIYQ